MKTYQVTINGKIMWIVAPSKKAIREFFFSRPLQPSAIQLRKDVAPDDSIFKL